jgi:hypothetical protein
LVIRLDYARWGQTPEDLRHLALSAPHARTRERALALFDPAGELAEVFGLGWAFMSRRISA